MDTILARLSRWQADRCDGEREHHHGITISSTDNPGWWVKIDLARTELIGKAFAEIAVGVDARRHPQAERWISCYVSANVWHGAGDLGQLEFILCCFLDWAEA